MIIKLLNKQYPEKLINASCTQHCVCNRFDYAIIKFNYIFSYTWAVIMMRRWGSEHECWDECFNKQRSILAPLGLIVHWLFLNHYSHAFTLSLDLDAKPLKLTIACNNKSRATNNMYNGLYIDNNGHMYRRIKDLWSITPTACVSYTGVDLSPPLCYYDGGLIYDLQFRPGCFRWLNPILMVSFGCT